jgi:hypothetical protein
VHRLVTEDGEDGQADVAAPDGSTAPAMAEEPMHPVTALVAGAVVTPTASVGVVV